MDFCLTSSQILVINLLLNIYVIFSPGRQINIYVIFSPGRQILETIAATVRALSLSEFTETRNFCSCGCSSSSCLSMEEEQTRLAKD